MEKIKNAAQVAFAKVAESAKALVAGVVVAATPVIVDALTDLSASEDRTVAVVAAIALVWLVPNRKAVGA